MPETGTASLSGTQAGRGVWRRGYQENRQYRTEVQMAVQHHLD